jgi:hypothetical protein
VTPLWKYSPRDSQPPCLSEHGRLLHATPLIAFSGAPCNGYGRGVAPVIQNKKAAWPRRLRFGGTLTSGYSSTAYWYADAGAEDFFAPRPPAERIAIPPERRPDLRDQATAKTFAGVRQRLAEIAKAIRGKATTAGTFVARRSVPLGTLRYAPLAVLPEGEIRAMADRFDGAARQGPAAQWKTLDLLLFELAARIEPAK